MNQDLPFSQACENNQQPIYQVLQSFFADRKAVLEIGSGTGQHSVFMAPRLPHLSWQPSDLPDNLPGINAWQQRFPAANLHPPVSLDVSQQPWPGSSDAVFTANSLHIMSWWHVEQFFAGLQNYLPAGGKLAVYGPFQYGGQHTAPSNQNFDQMLRQRDPNSGIRDFYAIQKLANAAGLALQEDHDLPANNRLLTWVRG